MLFAASIAIVVNFYPREGKFKYEYQKGKPWMHEVLIAPWDFPIYKSEIELNRERDSLLQTFVPYFNYDTTIYKQEIASFLSYYNELRLNRLGTANDLRARDYDRIVRYITGILKSVYSTGIYEVDDLAEQLRQEDKDIVLIKGNIVEEVKFSGLFTHKSAYENVKSREG